MASLNPLVNLTEAAKGKLNLDERVAFEGIIDVNPGSKFTTGCVVVSELYNAIYHWEGSDKDFFKKQSNWTKILKISFNEIKDLTLQTPTILSIRLISGKIVLLRVVTAELAITWLTVLKSEARKAMAAIKVQSAFRRYRAQLKYRTIKEERKLAVQRIMLRTAAPSLGSETKHLEAPKHSRGSIVDIISTPKGEGAGRKKSIFEMVMPSLISPRGPENKKSLFGLISPSSSLPSKEEEEGHLHVEGVLRKKDGEKKGMRMQLWRSRYFVLSARDGVLFYFDSKKKRDAHQRPRVIPFMTFLDIKGLKGDKSGKFFKLRTTSGRTYELGASTKSEADKWIAAIREVMPWDHVAALKIQSQWKKYSVMKRWKPVIDAIRADKLAKSKTHPDKCKVGFCGAAHANPSGLCNLHDPAKSAAATKLSRLKNIKTRRASLAHKKTDTADAEVDKAPVVDSPPDIIVPHIPVAIASTPIVDTPAVSITVKPTTPASPAGGRLERLANLKKKKEEIKERRCSLGIKLEMPREEVDVVEEVAKPAAVVEEKPKLKDEWIDTVDPATGRTYYYNPATGERAWVKPCKWKLNEVEGDKTIYVHVDSGEVRHVKPEDCSCVGAEDSDASHEAESEGEEEEDDSDLPPNWSRLTDPKSGRAYYYNSVTLERSWIVPVADVPDRGGEWVEVIDPATGIPYFWNRVTNERSWKEPKEYVKAATEDDEDDEYEDESEADDELGDWEELFDEKRNKPYYYNPNTGERRWIHPKMDVATEDVIAIDPVQQKRYEEEYGVFARYINAALKENAEVNRRGLLPISDVPAVDALLDAVVDGILLCELLNCAVDGAVDIRALNRSSSDDGNWKAVWDAKNGRHYYANSATGQSVWISPFAFDLDNKEQFEKVVQNQTLCIQAAKGNGCVVGDLKPEDVVDGDIDLLMDFIWQIIKLHALKQVNLRAHPELSRLVEDDHGGEDHLNALVQAGPSEVLLRWVNFILAAAGSDCSVGNFGDDFKDETVYITLVSRLMKLDLTEFTLATGNKKEARLSLAVTLLSKLSDPLAAFKLPGPYVVNPGDLFEGNMRLGLVMCAQLFTANTGLEIMSPEQLHEVAELLLEGDENSREERSFKLWTNNLDLEDMVINNIFEDLRSGVHLLKIISNLEPTKVNQKRINWKPRNQWVQVENCNYALEVLRSPPFSFSLVGIGGVDIQSGNKKYILSVMWQALRYQVLKLLSGMGVGEKGDDAVLAWANNTVAKKGRSDRKLKDFGDSSLSSGHFLFDLLDSVAYGIVNWELVTAGESAEEKANNARYALSVARKLGCTVFLTWEDIVEVKRKMMLVLVASIMRVSGTSLEPATKGAATHKRSGSKSSTRSSRVSGDFSGMALGIK